MSRPRGAPQPPAAEAPGHDPHAATGLAARPPRARAASSAQLGRAQARVLAQQRRRAGVGALEDRRRPRAAARSGSAPGPTGACRSARPRRAARGRSRPARSRRCGAASACSRGESAGPKSRHSDGSLAAPDAPAQLVQLRDPVALGVLDEHHGRVGDVDADLDDRGGHEHVGVARRERAPSPRPSRAGASGRAAARRGSRANSVSRRRSNSAVAARACSASDSLDERADDERLAAGAQLLADALVGARRARARRATTCVSIGWRPLRQLAQRGDVERAEGGQAQRARDRRRGHVQHVRREPRRGALASSAARWRTPKRCCSSTTATARRSNTTVVLDQRVRADDERQLAGARACPAGRRAARPASSRSAARRGTSAPGMSACSVAKCCSASVSVGAMSAACMPCSTARSIACSATTVLPEPTSPMSRRCIGRSAREVGVDLVHRGDLVAGRRERQQRRRATRATASAARSAASPPAWRAARRAGAAARSGRASSSSNASRARPRLAVAEVRGGDRGRGDRAGRSATRRRGGQRLDHVGDGGAVLADQRRGSASR